MRERADDDVGSDFGPRNDRARPHRHAVAEDRVGDDRVRPEYAGPAYARLAEQAHARLDHGIGPYLDVGVNVGGFGGGNRYTVAGERFGLAETQDSFNP